MVDRPAPKSHLSVIEYSISKRIFASSKLKKMSINPEFTDPSR
jgi:hypothetical protein